MCISKLIFYYLIKPDTFEKKTQTYIFSNDNTCQTEIFNINKETQTDFVSNKNIFEDDWYTLVWNSQKNQENIIESR